MWWLGFGRPAVVTVVIDACVALAWAMPEGESEVERAYCERVAAMAMTGEAHLIAPCVITAECAYQLLKRGRAAKLRGHSFISRAETIEIYNIEVVPHRPDLPEHVGLGLRHHAQGFDALSVELALKTGASLATLDKGMKSSARQAGVPLL